MSVDYILLALSPLFAIAIIAEYCKASCGYSLREFILNTCLALSHQASEICSLLLLMPLFGYVYQNFALFNIELNALNVLIAFIVQDFLYYWFHRASHRFNWLWTAHIVHHSSEHMNFSTAMRQSLFYPVVGMWIFWVPLVILGYPPELVFAIVALNLAFQFFVHTEQSPEFKWLGLIFNTPTHHCLHHAKNSHYIDKNFAGVLIIWDKLFGTFVKPICSQPPQYGVAERTYQLSLNDALLTPWRILLLNIGEKRSWRDKLKVLVDKPKHLKQLD